MHMQYFLRLPTFRMRLGALELARTVFGRVPGFWEHTLPRPLRLPLLSLLQSDVNTWLMPAMRSSFQGFLIIRNTTKTSSGCLDTED